MRDTGSIDVTCWVFVNILASFLLSVSLAGAFLLATLVYLGLEIYAFRYIQKIRRKTSRAASGGGSTQDFLTYLTVRWDVLGTVACGLLTAVLLVARLTLAKTLPDFISKATVIQTVDRVDDATRFLIVATTFFAMMRALVFLSNASLFFFVMDQALKASLVEFTGVHLVVALCLFGAAASNYLLAG
ncbi:polycystin cation channel protein, partial [Cystoisospora suis]